ncbi:MAG TPA: 3-hydroxybutyryl-CoA dehydrogenase [Longimicrobiales bacterium]
MADIRTVGVLGCGLMGSGIAEIAAKAGHETYVREVAPELVERGRKNIQKSLDRAVEKGKLEAAAREAALAHLHFTTALEDLADCDLVIEAVVEDLDAKNEMFRTLDGLCPARTIFASNTSSLPIAAMSAVTRRPDRFVGLHFFNPVPVMKLVEVVRTIATSQETFETAVGFARALGKEPVVARDTPGFIVNRLLVPYMLDAIRVLEQGGGTIEDIDKGMMLGCGYPMGPFTLGDFVGLDTLARIGDIMFDEYRETRFAPPPLLRRMIEMGYYGKKSGKGFYDYSGEKPVAVDFGI